MTTTLFILLSTEEGSDVEMTSVPQSWDACLLTANAWAENFGGLTITIVDAPMPSKNKPVTENMKTTKAEQAHLYYSRMANLGFSFDEANAIRRIEMTLQRWAELECGDGNDYASWSVERDDATGTPYMVTHPHSGESYRRKIADREAGALRRLQQIMAHHAGLWFFHQSDPRGCAVYIGRNEDVAGMDLSSVYTRGVAACI
jgi:hypothetical protein